MDGAVLRKFRKAYKGWGQTIVMKNYISFGGGVNSTAMLILAADHDIKFEAVYVNHGGDYPHTHEYINYLRDMGYEITEVTPLVEGFTTLYEYCIEKKIIPSRQFRWCTEKFKIRTIMRYIEKPCSMWLGIDSGEAHRARENQNKQVTNTFPLINNGINRAGCEEIIREHGLRIPKKSGCWFCPFMKKTEVRNLFLYHNDLFLKCEDLERNCSRNDMYIKSKPIGEEGMSHTPALTSFFSSDKP